jgi:hypothetical protein
MNILFFFLGIILLVSGRKLYWFFSAVAGMVAGLYIGGVVLDAQSVGWKIAFAVIGAIVGAILAVGLQKVAIGLAGFVAGGYGAIFLWHTLASTASNLDWIPFIIGGVIGAILVGLVFEYALIGLSTWAGATLIGMQLNLTGWVGVAAFFGLIIAGVMIQAVSMLADRKKTPANKAIKI